MSQSASTNPPDDQPPLRYGGRYDAFDPSTVSAYPLSGRPNKVKRDDLLDPDSAAQTEYEATAAQASAVEQVADDVAAARRAGRPVLVITGAHLIKNGLGPLLVDLIRRSDARASSLLEEGVARRLQLLHPSGDVSLVALPRAVSVLALL